MKRLLALALGTAFISGATLTPTALAVGVSHDAQVVKESSTIPTRRAADTDTILGVKSWDACPAGSSCYFSNANGGGDLWKAPSAACFNLGTMNPPFNDRISSVWNRGGAVVHMYNWTGTWSWVADVAVGQQWSVSASDSRNDVVDMVCIGRTP